MSPSNKEPSKKSINKFSVYQDKDLSNIDY